MLIGIDHRLCFLRPHGFSLLTCLGISPIQGIGSTDNFFNIFGAVCAAAVPGIEPAGIRVFLTFFQDIALAGI